MPPRRPFPSRRPASAPLLRPARLALSVLLAAILPVLASAGEGGMKWKEGDPAPDFSLADLGSGKAVRLSDHRGRGVVILEFWAPWCDICKTHLGNLARLQDGWRGRGVTVLSVAVNFRDEAELRQVACEKGVNFPVLPDGALEVAGRYGITGCLPLMVLVDAKGVVRYSHFGEFEGGDGPRRRIEALLSEVASPVPFSWRGEYCNGS